MELGEREEWNHSPDLIVFWLEEPLKQFALKKLGQKEVVNV